MYGYDVAHCVYDLAIDANIRRREKLDKDVLNGLYNPHFLREYCTVHVNLGRRSGKTQYIIENCTDKDIVIASNISITREIGTMLQHKFISPYRCHNIEKLKSNDFIFSGLSVDTIWVDEPEQCFKHVSYEDFLFVAAQLKAKNIFMFGE